MTGDPLYSVDTSALIDGLERTYFEPSFPGIWEHVADLIDAGRFFISEEVWEEAKKKDAVVKAWCEKDRTGKPIVPTVPSIANEVRRILGGNERLVMNMKGRNRADPFVISVARVKGATVVTGKGADGNEKRLKIPYVCGKMGLPCIRFADLIRHEGWVLRR